MSLVKSLALFSIVNFSNLAFSANPAFEGLFADPEVLFDNGTYYIYPTTDGSIGWMSDHYNVFSSKDLVTWQNEGEILNFADLSWGVDNAWAPTIAERDGIYYFYFCADQQIGVATATSPKGPFVDALGEPLVDVGEYGGQSIDPDVFIDDDGQAYLYFGQGVLNVAKLNADMVSFATSPINITPNGFNEGAEVFKRDGIYYLLWSEDDTRSENYRIGYAMASSPMGPFVNQNSIILQKNSSLGILGTGHNSVLKNQETGEYYMVYHRFAIPGGDGYHREIALDRMYFNKDGTIQAVVVTHTGLQSDDDQFEGAYKIINRNSNKVLTIAGDDKDSPNALIQQFTDENLDYQKWQFTRKSSGYFNISSVYSGQFLDILGQSLENAAPNVQNPQSSEDSQDWRIVSLGNGFYSIVNHNSGKLLDINEASIDDGAQNIQWPTNGGLNQQWQIIAD